MLHDGMVMCLFPAGHENSWKEESSLKGFHPWAGQSWHQKHPRTLAENIQVSPPRAADTVSSQSWSQPEQPRGQARSCSAHINQERQMEDVKLQKAQEGHSRTAED